MRIPATILGLLLLCLPCIGQQSANSDQNQTSSTEKQNQSEKAPPKHHSTADDNPFPEDISKKAADAAGDPSPAASSSAPPSAPPASPNPASDKSASTGEHSSSGDSSSRTGLHALDDADNPESRISDGAGGYIYNPKLAAQDVKVGGFYLDTGDYKGAYARFREATKVDPGNADAVFGLAEAARALKYTSEAAENYKLYLDAVPNGSKAKAARKALAALGESAKK
ncbi:MAG: tetratricopeptide repeat protein [Silvibacterium sp.]|nr:tetratricopeptide repeat protein [Silvibacterium sp.]